MLLFRNWIASCLVFTVHNMESSRDFWTSVSMAFSRSSLVMISVSSLPVMGACMPDFRGRVRLLRRRRVTGASDESTGEDTDATSGAEADASPSLFASAPDVGVIARGNGDEANADEVGVDTCAAATAAATPSDDVRLAAVAARLSSDDPDFGMIDCGGGGGRDKSSSSSATKIEYRSFARICFSAISVGDTAGVVGAIS